MHVRLVTEHCPGEPWALEWVWRVLAFECARSKASECIEIA